MSLHCPECGHTFHSTEASEAQSRIEELETQVRLLNSKASSYIERLADYEDEIRSLQVQYSRLQKERERSKTASTPDIATKDEVPLPPPPPLPEKDGTPQRPRTSQSSSRLSSFASYLPGRRKDPTPEVPVPPLNTALNRSVSNLATPSSEYMYTPSTPPTATDPVRGGQSLTLIGLQTSLETERHLRQQAETNLAQSQTELEELTAQLFGQANEMVAQERKARAKLEERVKTLETRDGEKRRRLDRLEKAVDRIERVRRMVVEHEREMGEEAYIAIEVPQVTRRDNKTSLMSMRQRRARSHGRQRYGYAKRPEIVSEDEEEDKTVVGGRTSRASSEDPSYEFDVQLKVWRRSRANIWRTPTFD